MDTPIAGSDPVFAITRPSPRLMVLYTLMAAITVPLFPIFFLLGLFRYKTLRYEFSDEGISMSWGVLFHREIHLTYARIQDIHLASNILERYLGLARIQIQTASGKAGAEMTIEGLLEHERVRNFIYSKMRGRDLAARNDGERPAAPRATGTSVDTDRVVAALDEVSATLRELRRHLEENPELPGGRR